MQHYTFQQRTLEADAKLPCKTWLDEEALLLTKGVSRGPVRANAGQYIKVVVANQWVPAQVVYVNPFRAWLLVSFKITQGGWWGRNRVSNALRWVPEDSDSWKPDPFRYERMRHEAAERNQAKLEKKRREKLERMQSWSAQQRLAKREQEEQRKAASAERKRLKEEEERIAQRALSSARWAAEESRQRAQDAIFQSERFQSTSMLGLHSNRAREKPRKEQKSNNFKWEPNQNEEFEEDRSLEGIHMLKIARQREASERAFQALRDLRSQPVCKESTLKQRAYAQQYSVAIAERQKASMQNRQGKKKKKKSKQAQTSAIPQAQSQAARADARMIKAERRARAAAQAAALASRAGVLDAAASDNLNSIDIAQADEDEITRELEAIRGNWIERNARLWKPVQEDASKYTIIDDRRELEEDGELLFAFPSLSAALASNPAWSESLLVNEHMTFEFEMPKGFAIDTEGFVEQLQENFEEIMFSDGESNSYFDVADGDSSVPLTLLIEHDLFPNGELLQLQSICEGGFIAVDEFNQRKLRMVLDAANDAQARNYVAEKLADALREAWSQVPPRSSTPEFVPRLAQLCVHRMLATFSTNELADALIDESTFARYIDRARAEIDVQREELAMIETSDGETSQSDYDSYIDSAEY
jgi:hypothetical protein